MDKKQSIIYPMVYSCYPPDQGEGKRLHHKYMYAGGRQSGSGCDICIKHELYMRPVEREWDICFEYSGSDLLICDDKTFRVPVRQRCG